MHQSKRLGRCFFSKYRSLWRRTRLGKDGRRVSEWARGVWVSGCPLHPMPHPATATHQICSFDSCLIVGRVPASCGTTDRSSGRASPIGRWCNLCRIQTSLKTAGTLGCSISSLLWLLLLSASITFSTTTRAVELSSDVGNEAPNWAPATNINESTDTRSSASAHTI